MNDKKYNYKILKEQNLVIKYYSGNFSLKDMVDCVESTWKDTDYLPTMFVLNDLRDCVIAIKKSVILDFINKIKKNPRVYAKRQIVFLTNTPNQVVFTSMIDLFKNEKLIELNTVSTIERALKYLMISESDYALIYSTLNELKLKESASL